MSVRLTRRAFGAAICAVAGGAALPTPHARGMPDVGPSLPRVPDGLLLRGANIVGSFSVPSTDTIWGGLWRTWDWNNWIRPQIEDAAGICNAIRFWGNTLALADGSIKLSQYLYRWQRTLDYASSLGLLVYPCGGDLRHWGPFTRTQALETFNELADLFSHYQNVIGVDVTNEASDAMRATPTKYSYRGSTPPTQLLESLGETFRARGLAVTHSRSIRERSAWSTPFALDSIVDFVDFHVYYPPQLGDISLALNRTRNEDKQIIIGEFGEDTTHPPQVRAAYYEAIRTLCMSDRRCRGAFAWSAWDLSPSVSGQWGLFDRKRELRKDIGDVFMQFPTR